LHYIYKMPITQKVDSSVLPTKFIMELFNDAVPLLPYPYATIVKLFPLRNWMNHQIKSQVDTIKQEKFFYLLNLCVCLIGGLDITSKFENIPKEIVI